MTDFGKNVAILWKYPAVEIFHWRGAKNYQSRILKAQKSGLQVFLSIYKVFNPVARWFFGIFGLSHSTAGVTLQLFQIDGYLRIFRTSVDADISVKCTRVRKEPVYFCSQLHDILGGMTRCPVPSVSRLFFSVCLTAASLSIYEQHTDVCRLIVSFTSRNMMTASRCGLWSCVYC